MDFPKPPEPVPPVPGSCSPAGAAAKLQTREFLKNHQGKVQQAPKPVPQRISGPGTRRPQVKLDWQKLTDQSERSCSSGISRSCLHNCKTTQHNLANYTTRQLHKLAANTQQHDATTAAGVCLRPPAMIFFLMPVFSSSFPRKSVTTFFSFRKRSARCFTEDTISSRPIVLFPLLALGLGLLQVQVLLLVLGRCSRCEEEQQVQRIKHTNPPPAAAASS